MVNSTGIASLDTIIPLIVVLTRPENQGCALI